MEYTFEAFIHWKNERRQEISEGARRVRQLLARMGYVPSGARPPREHKVQFEEVEIEGRRRRVRRWVKDEDLWPLVQRAWGYLPVSGEDQAERGTLVAGQRGPTGCWLRVRTGLRGHINL